MPGANASVDEGPPIGRIRSLHPGLNAAVRRTPELRAARPSRVPTELVESLAHVTSPNTETVLRRRSGEDRTTGGVGRRAFPIAHLSGLRVLVGPRCVSLIDADGCLVPDAEPPRGGEVEPLSVAVKHS